MARDIRHNAKLCDLFRFAAGHTIRHYVKCLPLCFVASFSSEPVRVVGRKRGFAQGPSPALTSRKTPYFAGPRPQSTWFLPPPALRSSQGRWSCGRGLPPDHLPCLPLPCWVAPAPSVSSQKAGPFPLLSVTPLPHLFVCSLPALALQGKPHCGLCLYSCSSRLSGRACQSTSAAHSAPVGRCVPLVTLGLLAIFLQKTSRRPIVTKAKMFTNVGMSVLCEGWFFMAAIVVVYKFFDSVELPADAGASLGFLCGFLMGFSFALVVRFRV